VKQSINEVTVDVAALEEAIELYKENSEKLDHYLDLLLDWNDKINLVSRSVSRETLKNHVIHSIIPVRMGLLNNHETWIDAGTGGGLPGIPLAICEEEKTWVMNDNVRKKMRVVEDIIDCMNLQNCKVAAKSISLVDFKKGTGIVTKHAFKMDDLIRLLGDKPWSTILMWKGADGAREEAEKLSSKIDVSLFRFDFGDYHPFYEGKALVLLTR
jgi:16S rRNA (guanine527-N7)-methyltransferase